MTTPETAGQEAVDVLVIGGGISGLTMAHELAERGLRVHVLEKGQGLGGKAISYFTPPHNLPGEHGPHLFPAFYAHFLNILERIPLDHANPEAGRVPDQLISLRPPDRTSPGKKTWRDRLDGLLLRLGFFNLGLMSPERSRTRYTAVSFQDYFDYASRTPRTKTFFTRPQTLLAARTDRCDATTICDVYFEALCWPRDQVLRTFPAPTHIALFQPWRAYLEHVLGVRFSCGVEVERVLLREDGQVDRVMDTTGRRYQARYYAFCVPVEILRKILTANPDLLSLSPAFASLPSLDGACYGGIQLYLRGRAPALCKKLFEADHPWLLVGMDHSSYFHPPYCRDFTVLSTVIAEWDRPGRFIPKPARLCTPQELIEEQVAVLKNHFPEADFRLEDYFIDPTLKYDPVKGWSCTSPLFISRTGTFDCRPLPGFHGPNLTVAGDFTRTSHVLTASMESACESGRQAARAILERENKADGMEVNLSGLPRWCRMARSVDGVLFRLGLPSPLDLLYRLVRAAFRRRSPAVPQAET
jgi:glycine/D-amino acid oxidase-like deaminating enzyme